MRDLITCSRCPATWTGLGRAHCSACHRTFSTVSAFDRHRSQEGERGGCLDPSTVGLTLRVGVWTHPAADPEAALRLKGMAARGLDGPAEGQDTGDTGSTAQIPASAVTA